MRMMARIEWEALEGKVAGTDAEYEGVAVECLLAAVAEDALEAAALEALQDGLDRSCKLVGTGARELVVGSLDLNRGVKLPSEALIGRHPVIFDSDAVARRRGYLSNVCTAPGCRKQGVGARLIDFAKGEAQGRGITDLYIHVVKGNEAALGLYEKCGFVIEVSARARRRPCTHTCQGRAEARTDSPPSACRPPTTTHAHT